MSPNPPETQKTTAQIVDATKALLRAMLDAEDFGPNTFREIHKVAKAAHEMLSTVDPILRLPVREDGAPLSVSPSSENYGAKLVREAIQMFDRLTTVKSRTSQLELVKAIIYAENHGMQTDADRLRAELHGDVEKEDDSDDEPVDADLVALAGETNEQKLERADRLLARSKALQNQAFALQEHAGAMLEEIRPYVADEDDEP